MKHVLVVHNNCTDDHCPICDGGLCVCSVCGGADSSLTTECSGKIIPAWLETAVSNSYVDFIGGRWLITERGKQAANNCAAGAYNLNTLVAIQRI
jgi:hypothetical protein